MIILSYLWLLALIPFLVEKEDNEVRWHAKHGLVLTAAEFILWIAIWIVTAILAPIPGLGFIAACASGLIWVLIWLAIIVIHIIAMVKGVKGERLVLPVVSQYADKF
jgi:uncharacterized membrane protein